MVSIGFLPIASNRCDIGAIMEQEYEQHVRYHQAVGDDGVPIVKIRTGTHIYAAAFGCDVHRFADNNPCARTLVNSAAAEHQFDSFKKIPNFYGFNRVSSGKGYLPLLDHFAGPGSPVHVLSWLTEEQTAELLSQAPAGTRFIFNLMGAEQDDAKAWLGRMRTLG